MKRFQLSLYTIIAVSIVALCSQGCSYVRVYKAMTAGNVHVVPAPDTIPFEYRNNKIVIKGMVNGHEYDFVVDTGAPTIIWYEVAKELQLPKVKASINATDANGVDQKLEFYKAKTLKVGKAEVEQVNLGSIATLSDELKCYVNGGIIGGNFLMHYNWQIDYENKRLIVGSDVSKFQIPKDAVKVEVEVAKPQGQIVINNIQLLGENESFILDTGNSGFLNLGMKKWDSKESGEKADHVEAYGYTNLSTGGRKVVATNIIQTAIAAPMDTIENAIIHVDTKSSLLGNGYLSQFGTITIDYTSKDQAVYFNRKKAKVAEKMSFGFTPIYHKKTNSFIVGKLLKNSEAERLGLKLDDKILSINGKDLSNIDYASYCQKHYLGELMYEMEGDRLALTILREGEKMDLELKKYPLFQ